MYGLSSAWLNVAEMRRLNGFQCRCLRVILRIRPAFVSRVSNAKVLAESMQPSLGQQLLKQQLLLYGRVARSLTTNPLRKVTFSNDLESVTAHFVRRQGRPRNEWAVMLHRAALKMPENFANIIHDVQEWRAAVHRYCID